MSFWQLLKIRRFVAKTSNARCIYHRPSMSAEICGPLLPSGSFTFIDMFRMHCFWKWFQIAVSMEVGFLLCAFVSGILSSITTDPSCSASAKRFVRLVGQTVRRIKHVRFRPTADPTVEACGHYVRLVGPTRQSDNQSHCSVRRRYLLLTS